MAMMRGPDAVAAVDGWRAAQAGLRRLYAEAKRDPALFNSLVLKDERTRAPVHPVKLHEAWHDLADAHDRLVLWAAVEHGKTQQLSIGRPLYELGRDRNLRVAIVSNTAHQATKIIRTIAQYIERSDELSAITGLRPGNPWTTTQLFVERDVVAKDPSVQACGIGGNILGSRIDLLILDDVLDYENCRTPEQRKKLIEWYTATLAGRLTAHSRVLVVGTAFYPDDLLHYLARLQGWKAVRYPAVNENTGEPYWPDRWPLERIARARGDMGPVEFARQLLCKTRSDTDARFKADWIQRGLTRGNGVRLAYGLKRVPAGCRTITGVDLAVQQHSHNDETVFFTIIVRPNGDRELLWIEAGRWAGPEIVDRIVDTHHRYHSIVMVENNAAQDFILQFARAQSAVPVRSFTTGRNKAHPEFGVEGIGAEMANGKWIIPNDDGDLHPEVDKWVNEMLYYDPSAHTGDRLMASWFAREGARSSGIKAEVGTLDLLGR